MAGKKILVADDSLTIQKVIRLALSGDGYEIQTVSDGKEAIEQASLFRPDICIIDVSLPHYDAYQIREHFIMKPDLKNIPVILMSSAFEKVDETRADKLGFAGHLVKPFDPSHLRSTLLSVANRTPENDPVEAMINEPIISRPLQFDMHDLPPLTSESGFSGMDDIQQLAKNTFEMSGLNQNDWGMIEPGKNEHPFREGNDEVTSFDLNEVPENLGHAAKSEDLETMVNAEVAKFLDQMNGQVHERVENELKRYAQELMPALAERIIKEEIHKLLANPPL
jgi:CheY-like chemotaxis protein